MKESTFDKNSFRFALKKLFGLGHQAWGTSDCCLDVEVNSLDGIKVKNEKFFEVPRKELFNQLTEEQKKMVDSIFATDKDDKKDSGKAVLVCTQPLYTAGHVSSPDAQIKVYEEIVKEYVANGFYVVIKPHPRDYLDYQECISKYHCGYIDKNIPSEILDYSPDGQRYYAAISVTSTSINFLDCAEKKIFKGMDFAQKIDKGKRG
jgi:hypothetical protein